MLCSSCHKKESELKFGHFSPCRKCFIEIIESRMKKEFRSLQSIDKLFLMKRMALSKFVIERLIKNPNIKTVRKNPTKIVLGITLDEEIAEFFAFGKSERGNVITPFRGILTEELEEYAKIHGIKIKKEQEKGLEKEFNDFFSKLESRRSGTKFSVLKGIDKLNDALQKK